MTAGSKNVYFWQIRAYKVYIPLENVFLHFMTKRRIYCKIYNMEDTPVAGEQVPVSHSRRINHDHQKYKTVRGGRKIQ